MTDVWKENSVLFEAPPAIPTYVFFAFCVYQILHALCAYVVKKDVGWLMSDRKILFSLKRHRRFLFVLFITL